MSEASGPGTDSETSAGASNPSAASPPSPAVHSWQDRCSCCSGSGKILRVDGLDLRRLRESHKISLPTFCAKVKRPGRKTLGVTVAFVSEVERGNKNCPEWLYLEYLLIPQIKYPKKKALSAGLAAVVEEAKVKAKRGRR